MLSLEESFTLAQPQNVLHVVGQLSFAGLRSGDGGASLDLPDTVRVPLRFNDLLLERHDLKVKARVGILAPVSKELQAGKEVLEIGRFDLLRIVSAQTAESPAATPLLTYSYTWPRGAESAAGLVPFTCDAAWAQNREAQSVMLRVAVKGKFFADELKFPESVTIAAQIAGDAGETRDADPSQQPQQEEIQLLGTKPAAIWAPKTREIYWKVFRDALRTGEDCKYFAKLKAERASQADAAQNKVLLRWRASTSVPRLLLQPQSPAVDGAGPEIVLTAN
jgi:hypothetical protein